MRRARALKVVLVVVVLLFVAGVYPLMVFVKQEPALAMMLSVYVTLGIFLLLAARDPSANRSLIAFTAWSSVAHAALMAVQAFRNLIGRGELVGCARRCSPDRAGSGESLKPPSAAIGQAPTPGNRLLRRRGMQPMQAALPSLPTDSPTS